MLKKSEIVVTLTEELLSEIMAPLEAKGFNPYWDKPLTLKRFGKILNISPRTENVKVEIPDDLRVSAKYMVVFFGITKAYFNMTGTTFEFSFDG